LLDQPDAAVALLTERGNQMLVKVRPEEIEKWIADLDSATFTTREAATKELARHLLAATPRMKEALAKKPSLEQQKRLESLLEQCEQLRPRMDLVVSVLSHLETASARRLLSQWAEIDSAGPLGRAAVLAKHRR
jgi:hypothetical protein